MSPAEIRLTDVTVSPCPAAGGAPCLRPFRAGQPDRGGRPERRRQVHPAAGAGRAAPAGSRAGSRAPPGRSRCCRRRRRWTAAFRSPASTSCCSACGARRGAFRAIGAAGRDRAAGGAGRRRAATGFERRPVGSLSAGQFQRVLFARLLLQDAPVILLDEPFNALDARTAADLLAMVIAGMARAGPWSPCCTTWTWCAANSPRRCCWRGTASAGARPREVLTAANRLRARMMAEAWVGRARRPASGGTRPDPRPACSRRSSTTASCAGRWWAAWRCRSRRRCSACS